MVLFPFPSCWFWLFSSPASEHPLDWPWIMFPSWRKVPCAARSGCAPSLPRQRGCGLGRVFSAPFLDSAAPCLRCPAPGGRLIPSLVPPYRCGGPQLSQVEMESAVAGTMETFRGTLQTALDRANATASAVRAGLVGLWQPSLLRRRNRVDAVVVLVAMGV